MCSRVQLLMALWLPTVHPSGDFSIVFVSDPQIGYTPNEGKDLWDNNLWDNLWDNYVRSMAVEDSNRRLVKSVNQRISRPAPPAQACEFEYTPSYENLDTYIKGTCTESSPEVAPQLWFSTVTGPCFVSTPPGTSGCVASPKFPVNYDSNQHCTITISPTNSEKISAMPRLFRVPGEDKMIVDGQQIYSGDTRPNQIRPTKNITWTSDDSAYRSASSSLWLLCGEQYNPFKYECEYRHLVGFGTLGRNLQSESGHSSTSCKRLCDLNEHCFAVEYATDRATTGTAAYPSGTCTLLDESSLTPLAPKYEMNTDLYGACAAQWPQSGKHEYTHLVGHGHTVAKSAWNTLSAMEQSTIFGILGYNLKLKSAPRHSSEACKRWCDLDAACAAVEYATDRATAIPPQFPSGYCILHEGSNVLSRTVDYSRVSEYANLDTYIKGATCTERPAALLGCLDSYSPFGSPIIVGKDADTVANCQQLCFGKTYMAIQNGNLCYCGDNVDTNPPNNQVSASQCSGVHPSCPVSNGCGGVGMNSIYRLRQAPYRSVMVNGDLTNNDNHGKQNTKFKTIYQSLIDGQLPLLLGLGNHDTYISIPDIVGHTMQFYTGYIDGLKDRKEIRDVDAHQFDSDHVYGSWSFAKDEGKYTFLFLQGSFNTDHGYDGEFYERQIDAANKKQYHFLGCKEWLMNQLCRARNMGQSVIILTHSAQAMRAVVEKGCPDALSAGPCVHEDLKAALTIAPILAIMSGHIHGWKGQTKDTGEKTQDIAGHPVLYIGSPFHESYTDVSFKGDGMRLNYKVFNYSTQEVEGSPHGDFLETPAPTAASQVSECWVSARKPPRDCDDDSDCDKEASRPVCDNRLFGATDKCIARRELKGTCWHDDTCASGYCYWSLCRCRQCDTKGCGGCGPKQYCADFGGWLGFEANDCIEYKENLKNGEKCDVSKFCKSGCCAKTWFGSRTCEDDTWWRTCAT